MYGNPVKAKICTSSNQYKWSSDICYRNNAGELVEIDLVLSMLSGSREIAIKKYIEYMNKNDDEQPEVEYKIFGMESDKNRNQTPDNRGKTPDTV